MKSRSGQTPTPAKREAPAKPLSPREREILELRRTGKSCKEVANELNISPNTLQSHMRRAFEKLGVRSTLEAIQFL